MNEEKFLKWCETVPKLIGNPLWSWSHMELSFVFGIDERINGENALTSEEMSYIASNGSKAIPILTFVSEKSAKDNAKIAITLLEDLKIERNKFLCQIARNHIFIKFTVFFFQTFIKQFLSTLCFIPIWKKFFILQNLRNIFFVYLV